MRAIALVLMTLSSGLAILAAPIQSDSSQAHHIQTYLSNSNKNAGVVQLTASQIKNELHLPQIANYAQSAYCGSVLKWTCGTSCLQTAGTKVFWTDGDNRRIPYVYVAHAPELDAIVIAHAGSNFDSLHSVKIDINVVPDIADNELDDGQSQGGPPNVHGGFHEVWLQTREDTLKQVKAALAITGSKTVICTGHSLGAAIAQLDAVYLRRKLSKKITVSNVGFGEPRVGNSRWAKLVDRVLGNAQVHIINNNDIVSRLPPKALGYRQAKNEIWIDRGERQIVLCKGNDSEECSNGISQWKVGASAHAGPYFGVEMNAGLCQ